MTKNHLPSSSFSIFLPFLIIFMPFINLLISFYLIHFPLVSSGLWIFSLYFLFFFLGLLILYVINLHNNSFCQNFIQNIYPKFLFSISNIGLKLSFSPGPPKNQKPSILYNISASYLHFLLFYQGDTFLITLYAFILSNQKKELYHFYNLSLITRKDFLNSLSLLLLFTPFFLKM